MSRGVTGLDLDAFGRWAADALPDVGPPLEATLIAGGKSNLTFAVTDGLREWIVRRPPLGHVLETAHDMAREYRVIAALQDTAVPVPHAYALCSDAGVLGAPFYVMERCPGTPFRHASELEPRGPARTRAIAEQLVDTLVALHSVDPVSVSLGDLGRPAGFLQRQVERWRTQLAASYSRDLPLADELYQELSARVPTEGAGAVIHGDYRLDNVLVDDRDRLTAVLDWEMATLGDPLTDLALMLVYFRLGANGVAGLSDVSTAPGFLDEWGVVERYSRGSGRDVSAIGFYLGLAAFKLAAILEGIHFRHLAGQTVGAGFDGIGEAIEPLLHAGVAAVRDSA